MPAPTDGRRAPSQGLPMTAVLTPPKDPRTPLQRRIALTGHRLNRLDPVVKGLLWSASARGWCSAC